MFQIGVERPIYSQSQKKNKLNDTDKHRNKIWYIEFNIF